MNAKELRIGNYVSDIYASYTFYAPVVKLEQTRCYYGCCNNNYKRLEPILLTEEWLLKFGFEKETHPDLYHYCGLDVFVNDGCVEGLNIGSFYCSLNLRVATPIAYVHQLQNLFFALTGKELELIK